MSQPRSWLVYAPEETSGIAAQARPEVLAVTELVPPGPEEGPPEEQPVIEQAKRVLMAMYRCGPDEASDMLLLVSKAHGLEVHVLAEQLVGLARNGLTAMPDAGAPET